MINQDSATTPAVSAMTLTLTGRVIEVGNLDGGNVPGFVIDRGDLTYATISGLTEAEARSVAWHYDKTVTVNVASQPVAAAPVAQAATVERALKELADEAQANGNSNEWVNAQVGMILAALQQRQAPAQAEDPVVEANRQLLLDRSRVGMAKYGTTLAGAGLSRGQLLQHALEESLDLSNYLQTLIQAEAAPVASAEPKQSPYGYVNFETLDYVVGFGGDRVPEGYYPITIAHATPAPTAEPVARDELYALRRLIECAQELDKRPRPMCRDCADENGTCPNSKLECDMAALFAKVKTLYNRLASPSPHPVSIGAGPLDADELTRLRRLIHALGMDGSMNASDETVRGLLFTALGQAAGKIERAAHPSPEGGAAEAKEYPAVKLTRNDEGMCEVSLELGGKWVSVLRDNGEFISHIVEPQGVRIAVQRSRVAERFANRPRTPATADFDLPAPNDATPSTQQETDK